jgi:hypothetical protein
MKNITHTFIDFFQNEDIKKNIKETLKPLVQILYNEIYIYIWFICIYNIFLLLAILANLYLLIRLLKINQKTIFSVSTN